MTALNELMEFDHVVHVHPDGTVTDNDTGGLHAPELTMEVDGDGQSIHGDDSDLKQQAAYNGWELLQGFTGQYSYNGPVMHPSEYIGGGLERHIRETPGYYAAVTVETDDPEDDTPAGWAIAYLPPELVVRDVWHYGNDRRETLTTLAALTRTLEFEADYGADSTTRAARRANVAAALEELKTTGTSNSWSWHTFTLQGDTP